MPCSIGPRPAVNSAAGTRTPSKSRITCSWKVRGMGSLDSSVRRFSMSSGSTYISISRLLGGR
jgi:hypothetical protein